MSNSTLSPPTAPTHDLAKLVELVKDVRVAMMTTHSPDGGKLHSRPMYTHKIDATKFDGTLWFMTDIDSPKVEELVQHHDVLLTYAAPEKNRYVVVSGEVSVEKNPEVARELWNVHAKGWWPGGPDDPKLGLIRVHVTSAEYWDGPSKVSYLFSLLKAVVKGNRVDVGGEHGKIET
ncbi:pyridoxamine 5'-phosphate oxidase family protein [Limnoglobus roseus]|uniref:General stress protein n=1 Tax=Limnoglobus roseus TaxID=2598579 RepID=A0A5C1A8X8_9BACT|nr:pyridoxamine 5'-phosphate oxidase family protein [Limnoglobus roseus]QEL14496.1 general stress protein [Limnoglobus roseus]